MNKKQLTFRQVPIVLHPFNNDVENFINVDGVFLQNIPLSKLGKMGISQTKGKQIIFDFLRAFRPWSDQEASAVDKILSHYKQMCELDNNFNTKCLFVGNSEKIRKIMRIAECPSSIIMLAETLESAALMTTLSAN
ncbi:MAG: hypothetical protein WAZ12_00400 [Candidatus Absconditicoccaceae bacterium]